jgi:hypothetical protein
MRALTDETEARLKDQRAAQADRRSKVAASRVGQAVCGSCHGEAHAQWTTTAHARAFDTLKSEGHQEESECLVCHLPAAASGEESSEPKGVGCEACHGPGGVHVLSPRAGYGAVQLSTCTGCHDRENSPEFDYYTYRERIVHRRDEAAR